MPAAATIQKHTPLPFYIPSSGTPTFTWTQKDVEKYLTNKTQKPETRHITQEQKTTIKTSEIAKPKRTPTVLPPHLAYPPTWRDLRMAGINLSGPGSVQIAGAVAGKRTFISFITFTVNGDTSITINFGTMGSSGPMDFGDIDEPRGIVMNFGDSPAPCGLGGCALASNGLGVNVGGFAVFYQEQDQSPI